MGSVCAREECGGKPKKWFYKYCSTDCRDAAVRKTGVRICEICGHQFEPNPNEVYRRFIKRRTCSVKCGRKLSGVARMTSKKKISNTMRVYVSPNLESNAMLADLIYKKIRQKSGVAPYKLCSLQRKS